MVGTGWANLAALIAGANEMNYDRFDTVATASHFARH